MNRESNSNMLRWVCSEGGPLLLSDERDLARWGGVVDEIEGPRAEPTFSPGGKHTEFDRACAVQGYLGRISIGEREALVLDDMPMQTTWFPSNGIGGGMLARWMFANSETEFLRWLQAVPDSVFRHEFRFLVERSPLVLFDSAFAGRNVRKHSGECLLIELAPGPYKIETVVYQPDTETGMVVHRFEPSI